MIIQEPLCVIKLYSGITYGVSLLQLLQNAQLLMRLVRFDLPNCPGIHEGDLSNSDDSVSTEYGGAVEIHRPDCDFCPFWTENFKEPCT